MKPSVDIKLQEQIQKNFPDELLQLENAGEKPAPVEMAKKMKIRVGNFHEDCEADDKDLNNIHKWTCFVRIKNDDLLKKCS